MVTLTDGAVPYWYRSLDWEALTRDYPPPPLHLDTHPADADAVTRMQDQRFLARVADAWQTPFYDQRWRKAGLEPGDIQSLDDRAKLPLFTSEDIRQGIDDRPPYGLHQSLDGHAGTRPLKIQTSGGTTGVPRATLFDSLAWEVQGIQAARALWMQGARPGDVIQIPRTCSLANAGWEYAHGIQHWLGGVPLTTGSGVVTRSTEQLRLASEYATAGWSARGEYLGRLVRVAQQEGFDLHQLKTRYLSAMLGTDIDNALRTELQDAWNAPVFDNYGTHEIGLVAFECDARDGMHIQEDTVHVDLYELDADEPVADGEVGRLIVTSLHRTLPAIVRYDVGDLFRITPRHACSCGLVTPKLSCFMGRHDEMVKLRGQNLFPRSALNTVLNAPGTNGEFVCVLFKPDGDVLAQTEMVVRVERADDSVDAHELEQRLTADLKQLWGVRVAVETVPADSLGELTGLDGDGKVKRLVDQRNADATRQRITT